MTNCSRSTWAGPLFAMLWVAAGAVAADGGTIRDLGGGAALELQVDVVDWPKRRVADAIAKAQGLSLQRAELLDSAPITLKFDRVATLMVMRVLAAEAGIDVRQRGGRGFVFGRVADLAEIERLIAVAESQRSGADDGALALTLDRLLELAAPNDANDLELVLVDVFRERVQLAVSSGDFALAERIAQRELTRYQKYPGEPGAASAWALLELARARSLRDERSDTRDLLQRALALLEREHGGDSAELAPALDALARLDSSQQQFAAAEKHWLRALKLLDRQQQVDPFQLRGLAMSLGLNHLQQEQLAAALPWFERAIRADDDTQLFAEAPTLRVMPIELLADALFRLQRLDDAALRYARIVSLLSAPEHAFEYARLLALRRIATIDLVRGRIADATHRWRELVALRAVALGAEDGDVTAARRELDLLSQLGASTIAPTSTPSVDAASIAAIGARARSELRIPLLPDAMVTAQAEVLKLKQEPGAPLLAIAQLQQWIGEIELALDRPTRAIAAWRDALDSYLQMQPIPVVAARTLGERLASLLDRQKLSNLAELTRARVGNL